MSVCMNVEGCEVSMFLYHVIETQPYRYVTGCMLWVRTCGQYLYLGNYFERRLLGCGRSSWAFGLDRSCVLRRM